MKTLIQKLKEGIFLGIGLLLTISIGVYATYQYTTYVDVADTSSGTVLSSSTFNQLLANVRDLDSRMTQNHFYKYSTGTTIYGINDSFIEIAKLNGNFNGNSVFIYFNGNAGGTINGYNGLNCFLRLDSPTGIILATDLPITNNTLSYGWRKSSINTLYKPTIGNHTFYYMCNSNSGANAKMTNIELGAFELNLQ